MVEVFGILLLFFLVIYCYVCVKNEGILFLFNYARLGVIIWTLALGLYNLKLSNLYQPNLKINIIVIMVILNFIVLMKILPKESIRLVSICKNIKIPKKGFIYALYFSMGLGTIAFVKNYQAGLLRFFSTNKGMRAEIGLSYFFHMLVVVSVCFYILSREEKTKRKRILYFFLCITTLFMEYTNLARGPLLFWLVGVTIYELYRFVIRRKSAKITAKQTIFILGVILLFIGLFGVVGDQRTATIFGKTANEYYQMKVDLPSGFTWVYIYITSPLENLRYSLSNDIVTHYSFFNKLLYPIIKFVANIVGEGDTYAAYVASFSSITPYLWNKVGLNMSTFMASAYQDFGYIGIVVYVMIYDLIGFFIYRINRSEKILNISKILIIPLLFEIVIWSVFTNSILGVTSIWSDIVFIMLWNTCNKIIIRKT